jgi:hypothetical protein
VTATSRTARPLVLFLAFADIAVALEVCGVELIIEIVGYGVVLLLGYALFGEFEKALFSCAVDDGLFAKFFLQEAKPLGYFVIEMGIVRLRFCVCFRNQAKVLQLH